MKKNISLLITVIAVSLTVTAQYIQIPSAVKSAFAKKFPNAVHIKWSKESAKEYEADFESDNIKMSANFSVSGEWIETEFSIKTAELSGSIVKAMKTKHPTAEITGAARIEKADGSVLYKVEFRLNKKIKEALFNVNAEFIN